MNQCVVSTNKVSARYDAITVHYTEKHPIFSLQPPFYYAPTTILLQCNHHSIAMQPPFYCRTTTILLRSKYHSVAMEVAFSWNILFSQLFNYNQICSKKRFSTGKKSVICPKFTSFLHKTSAVNSHGRAKTKLFYAEPESKIFVNILHIRDPPQPHTWEGHYPKWTFNTKYFDFWGGEKQEQHIFLCQFR